jgi:hypothetical protein
VALIDADSIRLNHKRRKTNRTKGTGPDLRFYFSLSGNSLQLQSERTFNRGNLKNLGRSRGFFAKRLRLGQTTRFRFVPRQFAEHQTTLRQTQRKKRRFRFLTP